MIKVIYCATLKNNECAPKVQRFEGRVCIRDATPLGKRVCIHGATIQGTCVYQRCNHQHDVTSSYYRYQ